jgi:hypothetical protein
MTRQIYRWDLDKTYLETDIDSVRGLLRSAVEPASAKRAVPGAPPLLKALGAERDGSTPRIVFLSGSPTQMRRRLEEKLRLDGVRFDEFILKNNLRNLRKGRFRAIRGQFGYKLPRLLEGRIGHAPEVKESLFGDDAEVDALVYSIYADAISGRLSALELSRILEAEGAYPDHVVEALAALRQIQKTEAVDRIFIHLARGRSPEIFAPLGSRVIPVRTWFQAALVLFGSGEVGEAGLRGVLEHSAFSELSARQQIEDILKRGAVPPEAVEKLLILQEPSPWGRLLSGVSPGRYREPGPHDRLDYLELLRRFSR